MSLIKNKEAAQSSITLLKQTNYLIDARLSQPPSSTWKSAIRFDYKPKEQVLKNLEEYHNRPPPFFTRLKVRTLKLLRIPEREEFLLTRYHRHRIIPDDGVNIFHITNLMILCVTSWICFVLGYKYAQIKYDFYTRRFQYGRSTSFMIIFDYLHERYEKSVRKRFQSLKEGVVSPAATTRLILETQREKRNLYKLIENEVVDQQLEREGSEFEKLIVSASKLKEEK